MAKDFFGRILNLIADRMRPYMTPDRPEGRPEGMRMFGIGEDDGIPEYGRGLTEREAGELLALSFQKSRADLKIHKGGRSSAQDSIAVPVPDLYGDGGGIGRNIIYTFFAKHCWIGYKNCSLLLQHWLINRCCSLPAEDASAGGYRLEYADNNVSAGKKEDSKKKADLLPKIQAAAERRYGLSDKLRKLGFNRAGYGTGIAYFVIDGEDPETPLNLDGIRSGSFRGITIIEPQWCEPLLTETNVSDPLSPGWYRPEWYVINGKKVHRSRLFTTLYREAPDDLKPTYNFGGIPLPQMIYERVYSAEKVANEMLELVQTKRTFVMQGNTMEIAKKPRQYEKIYNALSRFRNNQSIMVVDRTDENFTQMDTSLADTDGITWTLYQLVAGVASIPEYKLYGTAMKGLNSTGEGETKNYLQMLRGMQENVFEPFLRKAYAIICRSDLGNREKYDIVFNPLSVPTDAEQAATQGAKSSYYGNLINAGVVSPEEVRQALRQDENSGFTDIAEDLPEDAGGMGGGMPGNENGGQPPSGNSGGNPQSGQDEYFAEDGKSIPPIHIEDIERWITLKNKVHIPVLKGDTDRDAIVRFLVIQRRKKSKPSRGKTRNNYKPVQGVMKTVKKSEGKPDGTYDIHTGKSKSYTTGFNFSFHQNQADENGNFKSIFGRYTEAEYDKITNEIAEEFDLETNVGVFGNPEVSFHTEDEALAYEMCVKYNQHSYYDCANNYVVSMEDDGYDPKTNPIPEHNK